MEYAKWHRCFHNMEWTELFLQRLQFLCIWGQYYTCYNFWEGNVRKDFKILCNINAAVAWKDYMFFKDGRVCVWNNEKLINSSSPINHWLMNGNLDGCFQWLKNWETYLLKGSEYWVFDPTGTSIKHQADRKWNGLLQPSSKLCLWLYSWFKF